MKRTFLKYSILVGIIFFSYSCKDLLEQEPPDSLLPGEAIQSQQDLEQVLVSAYDVLANTYNGDAQNLSNLLNDDVARPTADARYESIWTFNSTIFNTYSNGVFGQWYIAVLRANTVIGNLDNVSVPNPQDRNRIEAEARFIRALSHFDVCRAYAHTYNYTPNNSHPGVAIRENLDIEAIIPRSSVNDVYNFILSDLAFAKENLPSGSDIFATQGAALALEAAVRFQMQEYDKAYELANEVINSGVYMFDENEVNHFVFPAPSPEYIFYIFSQEVQGNIDNRNAGFRGNWNSQGNTPNLRITQEFYDDITQFGGPRSELYEERDQDGSLFYVTNMFNDVSFNIPVLSITQMMLIRAESSAMLNSNLSQAIEDINKIRVRAYGFSGNNLLPDASAQEVLEAAREEFRFELPFSGLRIHDLKRRGAQGEDITIREANWDCDGILIQFPATERTDQFPINPGGGC